MSSIPWLDPTDLKFPATETALNDPNGLLAVGGDLSPERLIRAYRQGVFPWYEDPQPILWWSPSPRAVLFPANINVSRSLRKRLRREEYRVSCDRAFDSVMLHCAETPRADQQGTWITDPMLAAYRELHLRGVAHSLEVWHQDKLVGGLYGVSLGRVFFGESMFSLRDDASKVAFVALARQLEHWDFGVIDCQVSNPHLFSLGAEEIDRERFTTLLQANINRDDPDWASGWAPEILFPKPPARELE